MPQATFNFPQGFLWGTATAAHQVEGRNTNNTWWQWEQQAGRIYQGHQSGLACDWWGGRWKEDFDRAQETCQNAHRLSVEWSRIQPEPERWDEQALDRYREMLKGLNQRKMTAMVTLHHFSDPLWFAEKGGWENPESADLFAAYVRKVVQALSPYCAMWVTVNEPNVYAFGGWMNGGFPPGKNDMGLFMRVMMNLLRGHARAYHVIHELQPHAQVGVALNYRSFKPASRFPLDRAGAGMLHQLYNVSFLDACASGKFNAVFKRANFPEAAHTQDFIGINYYTRDLVRFNLFAFKESFLKRYYRKDADLSETGFLDNVPEGMYEALKWASRFKLPIYVTENGVEDSKDTLRPRYTLLHLHQMWRAIQNNWQIKGYFHWSLVDNFEWERGWTQRFGLWGLEVATQARIRRPSVDMYAEICRTNSIASSLVEQYAPEAFAQIMLPE